MCLVAAELPGTYSFGCHSFFGAFHAQQLYHVPLISDTGSIDGQHAACSDTACRRCSIRLSEYNWRDSHAHVSWTVGRRCATISPQAGTSGESHRASYNRSLTTPYICAYGHAQTMRVCVDVQGGHQSTGQTAPAHLQSTSRDESSHAYACKPCCAVVLCTAIAMVTTVVNSMKSHMRGACAISCSTLACFDASEKSDRMQISVQNCTISIQIMVALFLRPQRLTCPYRVDTQAPHSTEVTPGWASPKALLYLALINFMFLKDFLRDSSRSQGLCGTLGTACTFISCSCQTEGCSVKGHACVPAWLHQSGGYTEVVAENKTSVTELWSLCGTLISVAEPVPVLLKDGGEEDPPCLHLCLFKDFQNCLIRLLPVP